MPPAPFVPQTAGGEGESPAAGDSLDGDVPQRAIEAAARIAGWLPTAPSSEIRMKEATASAQPTDLGDELVTERTATNPAFPAMVEAPRTPRPRGFAAMKPEVRSAISSRGGKAAHAVGTAHKFTSDEARAAGRKGGNAPHARRGPLPRATPLPQASDAPASAEPA